MQQNNIEKQSMVNGLGCFYLATVLSCVGGQIFVFALEALDVAITTNMLIVFSAFFTNVPLVIFLIRKKPDISEDLGFKKIHILTIFISLFMALPAYGVGIFANVLSQLFVTNVVTKSATEMITGSGAICTFLFVGIIGPFYEEIIYRGVIDRGYLKYATPLKAVLASALLFAMYHLNINQMSYALLLGIIFSVVNKASGSILTSYIIHAGINAGNVLMMIASSKVISEQASDAVDAMSYMKETGIIYILLVFYFVIAMISLVVLAFCVIFIAKIEGNYEAFVAIFTRREKQMVDGESRPVRTILNPPTLIALAVCLFFSFFLELLIRFL